MPRRSCRSVLVFVLLVIASAASGVNGGEKKLDSDKVARDALVEFDKHWKDYTNEPNYGDPRWKLKMAALVGLAKAGAAATPVLEAAAKGGSPWAPHTRELATHVLKVWRESAAVRDAWASYDLPQMDSAMEGKPAPNFALADAAGRSYRLSAFRGKKTVVLTFILQDI